MKRRLAHPNWIKSGLLLSALLLVAGCQPAGAPTAEPLVVADLFATPGKSLATMVLSPTPEPTSTIPYVSSSTPEPTLPLPTVVVLQPTSPIGTFGPVPTGEPTDTLPPLSCDTPPPMPFTPIWQNIARVRELLRCPVGETQQVAGVFQTFEYGYMFWREADHSIFVISDNAIRQGQETDSWWRVDDTYTEGEPEFDPDLVPPEGLRQPVRGFGKAWRQNGFIRGAVGWATGEELSYTSLWQAFEKGWMMTAPGEAPIFVMIPTDEPPYSGGIHLGPMP